MLRIGDKVRVTSKNENENEEDFLYYGVIDGIQIRKEGNRLTMGGRAINTAITKKCTKAEITKYYV